MLNSVALRVVEMAETVQRAALSFRVRQIENARQSLKHYIQQNT